jgi:DNA-binding CsgD family transcriptional regulator
VYREKLEPTLERLQTTKSIEDLQVWAHELRDQLAVQHVIYHTANLKGEQVGAFTYDIEWVRHYIARNYRAIDPVVLGALRRFHPMDWKSLDWSSAQARQMMREALEHGLGNQGWSVPIWGPSGEFAMFSVNHQADDAQWQEYTRAHAKDILLISHLVHQQARKILDQTGEIPAADLSPREREVLARLSFGESRARVADGLHISENTLRAYVDSARHKLGAMNVTHAVALATARGIIVPNGALPKY